MVTQTAVTVHNHLTNKMFGTNFIKAKKLISQLLFHECVFWHTWQILRKQPREDNWQQTCNTFRSQRQQDQRALEGIWRGWTARPRQSREQSPRQSSFLSSRVAGTWGHLAKSHSSHVWSRQSKTVPTNININLAYLDELNSLPKNVCFSAYFNNYLTQLHGCKTVAISC